MPPIPIDVKIFLLGVLGSLAVEIVNIVNLYEKGRPLSTRYKSPVFLVTRLLLAIVGGALAWAYNIDNNILAIHIGATAPLIMQSLAQLPPRVTRTSQNQPPSTPRSSD